MRSGETSARPYMHSNTFLPPPSLGSISATVGSYCLSVKLAGYVYDRQVALEHAKAAAAGLARDGSHKCTGAPCFRPTFLIMAAVCGVGVLALMRLVGRTRRLYQDLYKVQTR